VKILKNFCKSGLSLLEVKLRRIIYGKQASHRHGFLLYIVHYMYYLTWAPA